MEQKIEYLRTLMYIASVDDTVTDDEYACFTRIAIGNGLTEDVAACIKAEIESGEKDISSALSELTDNKAKKQLIRDLLSICYADGSYSIPEQSGIREICNVIGVENKQLKQLEFEAKIGNSMHKATGIVMSAVDECASETVELGKKTIIGSTKLMRSVSDGLNTVGSKISFSLESAKKAKEENKALREQLKKTTLTEAIKQKVIVQLGAKISALTEQLQVEKKRNEQNEEMIRELQSQIDDLMATMEVAQNAKTA